MALNIRPEIRSLQSELVNWRRSLHRIPEIGFEEHLTSRFIAEHLSSWGISHETGIAETGITATIHGHHPGPTIAVRADMDALPVTEENEVPYHSIHEGKMHACGHDGHMAIALGLAHYLKDHTHNLKGTVRLIFQPAEEGLGGALPMIESGMLDDPPVDVCLGLHLWNTLPAGSIAIESGAVMAAVELFDIKILGVGGHGGMPHQAVDALVIGARVVEALQTIVSRSVDPLQAAVVSIGSFQAGNANNVIAGEAVLSGTVRYFDKSLEGFFNQRIEDIVAGVCRSHGAQYELTYRALFSPLVNDAAISDLVRSVATDVFPEEAVNITQRTMAGEDFAYFLRKAPGCFFFLGSGDPTGSKSFPHHHPRFNIVEDVLQTGVEMFVRIIERLNNDSAVF